MTTVTWLILCIACVAVGAVAVYFVTLKKTENYKACNNELNGRVKLLEITNSQLLKDKDELNKKLDDAGKNLLEISSELSAEQQKRRNEEEQNKELKSELDKLKKNNDELNHNMLDFSAKYSAEKQKNEWVDKADDKLRETFNSLSKEIIENTNVDFLNKANDKLNDFASKLDEKMQGENRAVANILTPVSENLTELKKHIGELEEKRVSAYSDLNKAVEVLRGQNDTLTMEARNLNSALHNSSVRGKWGEVQLRRVAELSGMNDHIDFDEQKQNESGKRPDMIIHLSGGRTIPVDSKVPMEHYLKYVECKDDVQNKVYLQGHVKAVKTHIDALAKKEYWKSESRAMQLVVLVIPYESGLSAAFEGDPELFEYAESKNVLLLSPVTFYAFLKAVSTGWTEYNLVKNAQEIAQLSKELIDRFDVFIDHVRNIGSNIDKAAASYNKAVSSYNTRLNPTFNKLKALKELPEQSDIETVQLINNIADKE